MPSVYCITNQINGKRYVGQTIKPIAVRLQEHLAAAKSGNTDCVALFGAIRAYGAQAFVIEEIERVEAVEMLDEREQFHIKRLNTLAPRGYNLTPGGVKFRMTLETREKIRRANAAVPHTPEWNAKIGMALRGKPKSQTHKERLSAAKAGKRGAPHTAEWKAAASARMKGNKNGQGNKGKPLSEETQEKLSRSRAGSKLTEETRRKISASLIGNTRRRDYKLKQASNEQG